jgi:hypothetical protein
MTLMLFRTLLFFLLYFTNYALNSKLFQTKVVALPDYFEAFVAVFSVYLHLPELFKIDCAAL